MFILISEYLKAPGEVDAQLENHRAWIRDAYESGRILFSGRLVPATGGAIALRAGSSDEVSAFIATDPYVRHGLVKYAIHEVAETPYPYRNPAFDEFVNSPYDSSTDRSDA